MLSCRRALDVLCFVFFPPLPPQLKTSLVASWRRTLRRDSHVIRLFNTPGEELTPTLRHNQTITGNHTLHAVAQQCDADCQAYAFVMERSSSHCHLPPWLRAARPTSAGCCQLSERNLLNKCLPISRLISQRIPEECGSFNQR